MNLKLENIQLLTKEIFLDMQEQFPPEEMKTLAEFNTLLKNNKYFLEVLYADNETAGYILYYKSEFLWIDYIAVLKKYHSKGFGSKVLQLFFEKHKNLNGCYFEVEKENPADTNTTRRLNFYKKLGCLATEFKYFFPNDIKHLEMNLLYKELGKKTPEKKQIFQDITGVFQSLHSNVKCCESLIKLMKTENKIPE